VGLSSPTVLLCLGHGQTGFLTAALLTGGILTLNRSQFLAGMLFGLAAIKPQIGLLLPLALAAGGYWRTFSSAALTVLVLIALTIGLWGWPIWEAFLGAIQQQQVIVLHGGGSGFEKFQSAFAWLRLWNAPLSHAYALQAFVTVVIAGSTAWIWHQNLDLRLKGAALLVGTLLSTPYVLDYDFVLLGMANAFMISHGLRRGFLPWEKTALALMWLLPSATRSINTFVPTGFLLLSVAFAFVLVHALHETRAGPERYPVVA
jgi:hypothetical protein